MGLTIYGENHSPIPTREFHGSYNMLKIIREEVLKAYDDELYKIYVDLLKEKKRYREFNKKANERISLISYESKYDENILDFLFSSNIRGKINYETCKKIYDLIKDTSCNKNLNYFAYKTYNDWEEFKNLLLDCYHQKANLVWR